MSVEDEGFKIALEECKASAFEGGIPVGSAIVSPEGEVIGRGRNMRIQNGSHILHVCFPFQMPRCLVIW